MIARLAFMVMVVVVAFGLWSQPAEANDELEPFLESQAGAAFSGQQTIVCQTPDGVVSTLMFVEQARGMRITQDVDGSTAVTMVSFGDEWELSDRYEVEVLESIRYLGRTADRVAVMEGGDIRVLLLFDRTTGALLSSDVRNNDGSTYCASRVFDFDARAPQLSDDATAESATEPAVLTEIDESILPAFVAGFERIDAYESDRSVSAYYADGVFSFTLFAADRQIEVPELANAAVVEIEGDRYRRQFFPGQVFYSWDTPNGGYVLFGDLPLDLQERVLAELPRPGRANILVRWWRNVFG